MLVAGLVFLGVFAVFWRWLLLRPAGRACSAERSKQDPGRIWRRRWPPGLGRKLIPEQSV